ncbi:hypothetical protein EGH21_04495 [Halomicroarcula sp. F13]|uniref:DUF7344 domain-containing protein n=1 Tax=Haloarcula rubra TaxID=2487747 RepID=A0AAW4PNG7_9EURY|nr:hypothetical protein [Halomicroarcula rubra]MBX0322291.1 hypothetical protein [Halomicroarcula rubra]
MSKATSPSTRDQSQRAETETQRDDHTVELSRDETFEMLSNRRRRYTLHHLQDTESAVPLSDLAEQVAAWENDTTVRDISASERKTVYTSLQQFHLPKMDETGVVEFHQRDGTVELTDAAADLDIYLELVDRYDIPWSFYYMGLSAIGCILVTLSWLGVQPFAVVPFVGWTVFLLGTFGVSSASHYYLSRRMRLGSGESPPEVDDA